MGYVLSYPTTYGQVGYVRSRVYRFVPKSPAVANGGRAAGERRQSQRTQPLATNHGGGLSPRDHVPRLVIEPVEVVAKPQYV